MKKVERAEVLELPEYEQIRDAFRRRIIELKRLRRIPLGQNMTVLFENHDTVLFHVQEMLRTERITREDAVLHELDTYNALIPAENELSATIFLEYPEAEQRDRMLVLLAGIEDAFYVEVDGVRYAARNETGGTRGDRTTAVHYAKFPLGSEGARAVREGAKELAVGVEHAEYSARTDVSPGTLSELRADLL